MPGFSNTLRNEPEADAPSLLRVAVPVTVTDVPGGKAGSSGGTRVTNLKENSLACLFRSFFCLNGGHDAPPQ